MARFTAIFPLGFANRSKCNNGRLKVEHGIRNIE